MTSTTPVRVNHFEGDPNGCSDHCSRFNIHPGDEITGACTRCGGSARGCAGAPGGCVELYLGGPPGVAN